MPATEEEAEPIDELLGLAISDPARAEAWAGRLIAAHSDPSTSSVAHQARGIVLRDQGLTDPALAELRIAVRLGRRAGDGDRVADVRATLGVTLALAGRTRSGIEQLDLAASSALDPTLLAKIRMRRAHVFYFLLARPHDALADLEQALARFRVTQEPVWLARTLNLHGLTHLALGHVHEATQAVREAEGLFLRTGQEAEAVATIHNRGFIAYCSGDLPAALGLYDQATERGAVANVSTADMVFDQCEAMLAAGLAAEAVGLARAHLDRDLLTAAQRADLVFVRATAELAADEAESAVASASQARRLFQQQRRDFWVLRAELAMLLPQQHSGRGGRRLVRSAASLAQRLEDTRNDEAAVAWLLAGQLARGARLPEAAFMLDRGAVYRNHSSDLVRATGWQARALRREGDGDRRGVLAACRRGLDALDTHRATLGSTELRALAARHGDDLAALALRHALPSGPRVLLEWSERWRAAALTQPPVHPPDDRELAQSLAALRDTRRRLAEASAEGSPTASRLDEERVRWERSIRRRNHHLAGASTETSRFEVARLVEGLGGTTFVELVDIDAVLHALVARSRRVTHVVVGPTTEAEQAVAFARFALRQTARGRPSDLVDVGHRLQMALLGDAVRRLGDGPVVVSPPGRLHATPWALVPALTDVPISVAPSAALWLRARASTAPSGARVLIAGPGLESGGAELDTLALRHPDARLLRGVDATVERSLAGARRCGGRARRGPREVPRGQPAVLVAGPRRRAADGARPRAARPSPAPDRAVGVRVGGGGADRCRRDARPGVGDAGDGVRGDRVERGEGQRPGHR